MINNSSFYTPITLVKNATFVSHETVDLMRLLSTIYSSKTEHILSTSISEYEKYKYLMSMLILKNAVVSHLSKSYKDLDFSTKSKISKKTASNEIDIVSTILKLLYKPYTVNDLRVVGKRLNIAHLESSYKPELIRAITISTASRIAGTSIDEY